MSQHDLLKLDVTARTEKKNGLTYLSWAWAWSEALKADPAATWRVDSFEGADGTTRCFMDVNGTAMVWVTATMFGKPMTCMLPVMNHRNQPIQNPDAFQLNTAIMRCMTKALALHGLGLYIYAGEDLPMDSDDEPAVVAEAPAPSWAPAITKENADLFAEGMLEYVSLNKTLEGLLSYWKANQETLDAVKKEFPELFEKVKQVFAKTKAEFLAKTKKDE